jgi:hypothetical protein
LWFISSISGIDQVKKNKPNNHFALYEFTPNFIFKNQKKLKKPKLVRKKVGKSYFFEKEYNQKNPHFEKMTVIEERKKIIHLSCNCCGSSPV